MKNKNRYSNAILIFTFIVMLLYVGIAWIYNTNLFLIGGAALAFEAAIIALYIGFSAQQKKKEARSAKLFDGVSLEFFLHSNNPIAVVDGDGAIVWYNDAFTDNIAQGIESDGIRLSDLCDSKLPIDKIFGETDNAEPVDITVSDATYRLGIYNFDNKTENSFALIVFNDRSELANLKHGFARKNPVVSYIAIDNYSEATGATQEKYRAIAVKISEHLNEWASGMDGILRETDRERYILVLEECRQDEIMAAKYDILDKVRELSVDLVDIPLTISIGTACIDGTLAEKERAAEQALDLALQRGGDQAVVRSRANTEFYGGRTKTVQKRTKIRSRIIAGELSNMFCEADNVLIMGHKYADHDSIGSCVGMARLAMLYCSKVNIVVNVHDVNLKSIFQKLRGVSDYRNVFIDSSTAQDMITSKTFLVVMDVNNFQHFEAPELYENCANVAIIDHHRKAGDFPIEPRLAYIEPSASSASELVSEILEQVLEPGGLLKEEAELLFSGIILDTKQFTRNTGVRTFSAALYLRGEGASPGEAQMLFKTDLGEFLREVKFENNIIIYRDIIAISIYEGEAEPSDKIAASKAAERLLGVEGVLASFALCTIENCVHISARSTGTVNVQLILENMGGGGHFDAAGAQLKMNMTKALTVLKEAIDAYLSEE